MEYKYVGLPLNSGIMTELTLLLLEGQFLSQKLVLETTRRYHMENGGLDTKHNGMQIAKVALRNLKERKRIEATAVRNNWRWTEVPTRKSSTIPAARKKAATAVVGASSTKETVEPLDPPGIDRGAVLTVGTEEGTGTGSVYVYWFETYRREAVRNGQTRWPLKIGMTVAGDARSRIMDQQGTAMPEYPVIGYIRHTDYPSKIERIVHDMLYIWDAKIDTAPGKEWFLSNPEEVREIVNITLNKQLFMPNGRRRALAAGGARRSPDIPVSGEFIVTDRDDSTLERAG